MACEASRPGEERRPAGSGQRATCNVRRAASGGRRAAGSGQRAHLKRGESRTGLTNPVLGAARRLTAEGALRATTVRERSNGQRATGGGRRAAGNERRAAGNGQRAAGSGQRAASSGQRAAGSLEKRCFSHGVSKPRAGRRSKTHGGRCASRDHRQRAQQRATGGGQRADLKRGVSRTGLANPVLGAVRRLTAEGALRATTVSDAAFREACFSRAIAGIAVNVNMRMAFPARCPLPAARCPLPAARCSLPAARCPLPAARCPLLAARCPLLVARCPLPVAARSDGGRAKRTFRRESSSGAQHGVC
jgi:hypothetical protein